MTDQIIDAIDQIDDRILSQITPNDLTVSVIIFFTVLIYQTALGIFGGRYPIFSMLRFDTLKDPLGLFDNERPVKYKLEDDQSCGITTGASPFKHLVKFIPRV